MTLLLDKEEEDVTTSALGGADSLWGNFESCSIGAFSLLLVRAEEDDDPKVDKTFEDVIDDKESDNALSISSSSTITGRLLTFCQSMHSLLLVSPVT